MGTADLTNAEFWRSASSYALSAHAPLAHAPAGSVLVQTSGSEGRPKWVVLTKHAFLVSAEAVNRHLEATADDRWLIALPTHHVGGFSIFARAFLSGSSVHRFDEKWEAQRFADTCRRHAITLTSLVPTQVFDLVQARVEAPASMRAVVLGGGGLSREVGLAAAALGWPVLQSYGMTEAASQVATEPLDHLRTGFDPDALEVLPHWDVRLNEKGQLVLRGEALATGYLCQPEPGVWTQESIGEELVTRDQTMLWSQDGRRFLRFVGRESQMLKIMGELVHLGTLQAQLEKVSGDGRCVIVDVPDERRGRGLVLVHETSEAGKVMDLFNESVAPYERVLHAVRVHEIPRSALGKVRLEELRERLRALLP